MKWIGQLLVFVSLTAGALSAASAYHAWLDLPDAQLVGLTLNDGAGVKRNDKQQYVPRFPKGHVLTAEDLAELRRPQPAPGGEQVNLTAVRVKEFSFVRWQHKWGLTVFVVSMVGMVAGSLLTRYATRRRRGAAEQEEAETETVGPDAALRTIADDLVRLQKTLATQKDPHLREQAVVEQIGRLQQEHVPDFVETHAELIDRLGIGHAAEVMDRFAAAERSINRAWSAASDGDADEADQSLAAALTALDEARQRLNSP